MSYSIVNLTHYPQTGEHQCVRIHELFSFPFSITKGEDTWYFYNNGVQEAIKPKLWYVFLGENQGLRHPGFKIKGFRKPELAVKYGIREYKKWLRMNLKKVAEFKIEESH